jgi:type IV pilus assembly protein PilQ
MMQVKALRIAAAAICLMMPLSVGFTGKAFGEDSKPQVQVVAETPAAVPSSEIAPADEESVDPTPVTQPGNVSLDFKDADINNVLRILSLKSKMNIITGPEVQGVVSIRLEDVPWEKALDVVLRTYGYVYERDGNIIRVTTKENLTTEDLITETFILNYTTAKEAEEAVKDVLSERGRIKSVARTNMLVITDIPTNLYKISEVIKNLDKNTPQAYVDSKIIKTQLQKGENLGIAWNPTVSATGASRPTTFPFSADTQTPPTDGSATNYDVFQHFFSYFFPNQGAAGINPNNPQGFPLSTGTSTGNEFKFGKLDFSTFSATLNFLKSRSNTKIVSNPRITVLNNQTAKIKVGTDIALPTFERNETTGSFEISGYSFRETGVVMEVTPHINNADEILVDLKPEVSSQDGYTTFAGSDSASFSQIPNFAITNAQTQVMIRNGETIAIGGLMSDKSAISEKKVPILGEMPLVGKLFRNKEQALGDNNTKSETLFFVTVSIIDTSGEPTKLTVPQKATFQGAGTGSGLKTGLPVEKV